MDEALRLLVAAGTLIVAIVAMVTSVKSLQNSYKPLLRPVPQFKSTTRELQTQLIMVKNIGNGPAVSVVVYRDGTPPLILGSLHVVEKPGSPAPTKDDPLARPGRDRIWFTKERIELGAEYRLAYQDAVGAWHVSSFAVHKDGFVPRLLGRAKEWWHWPIGGTLRVPDQVKEQGQIIPAEEL
jgi:hypothetical protein